MLDTTWESLRPLLKKEGIPDNKLTTKDEWGSFFHWKYQQNRIVMKGQKGTQVVIEKPVLWRNKGTGEVIYEKVKTKKGISVKPMIRVNTRPKTFFHISQTTLSNEEFSTKTTKYPKKK